MANGEPNKFWQIVAVGSISLLFSILLTWGYQITRELDEHQGELTHRGAADRWTVEVMKRNMEAMYDELAANRAVLRRIDKNTGGSGDIPDMRPLATYPQRPPEME